MKVTITSTFVCDELSIAERLKRMIETLVIEHGQTWCIEVDFEVDNDNND